MTNRQWAVKARRVRHVRVVAAVSAWICVGCAAAGHTIPTTSAPVATATQRATPSPSAIVWVQPNCAPSHFLKYSGMPEVQGIIPGANQLWLLMFAPVPMPRGQSVKIAYQMTGSGPLRLVADGPDHVQIAPDWEQAHTGGSTWTIHPGDQWGAGFTFTQPGCWEVVALRGSLMGRVGIPVA